MALVKLEQFLSYLICPRCRASLSQFPDKYHCTNQICAYSNELKFPVIGSYPALIDFEQSILSEDEVIRSSGASVIRRDNSPWKERIKSLLFKDIANNVSRNSAVRLKALLKNISDNPVVLIIGGGSMGNGTEVLYDEPFLQLLSFDIYGTPLTQFIADGHQIPLADQSIDAVWIQSVLEHVLNPWQVVSEIYRVLKKNGLVYAETPFMQQVHEGPYDFTRFTESGHRWLFKNFALIDSGVVMGPGTQLLWTIEHMSRDIFRSMYVGKLVKIFIFWVHYLDKIIPKTYAIDNASSIFFLGEKAGEEIKPKEMVSYYQGLHKK